jgi:hypothetical protein
MTVWSARPATLRVAIGRFLTGQGNPPDGVTILGRWHKADCSGGITLMESDNPASVYEAADIWVDVLDIQTFPVIEDADAGPILANVFSD